MLILRHAVFWENVYFFGGKKFAFLIDRNKNSFNKNVEWQKRLFENKKFKKKTFGFILCCLSLSQALRKEKKMKFNESVCSVEHSRTFLGIP